MLASKAIVSILHPPDSDIREYWEPRLNATIVQVLPGQVYASIEARTITTVLGSCVAFCLYDCEKNIGGMNHYMLPTRPEGAPTCDYRYGEFAMAGLLKAALELGSKRESLQVKLVGGGRIVANMTDVGRENIAYAHRFVAQEALCVTAEDLGGSYSRKVRFDNKTGKMQVKRMRAIYGDLVSAQEAELGSQLATGAPLETTK